MTIKIIKNDQDITDIRTKFEKTYVDGFFPTEDVVEEYKLVYDPTDSSEVSATIVFPNISSPNDPFQVRFFNALGETVNGQSIRFEEASEYNFTVTISSDVYGGEDLDIGLNTANRKIDVILNDVFVIDDPTPIDIDEYVTRIYNGPNSSNELYQRIVFDNVIPLDEEIDLPFEPIANLDLGVNIYEYDSDTEFVGPKLQNLSSYEYFLELENVRNAFWNLFVNGEFLDRDLNFPNSFVYGPIPSTEHVVLNGYADESGRSAQTDIKYYSVVDGIKSEEGVLRVDMLVEGETPISLITTTTTTSACKGAGEECIITNEETGENNCCQQYICEPDPSGFICV